METKNKVIQNVDKKEMNKDLLEHKPVLKTKKRSR